jgi:signal transduction histidine kinase
MHSYRRPTGSRMPRGPTRPRLRWTRRHGVWAIAAALAAAGVALQIIAMPYGAPGTGVSLPVWSIALGFAATEVLAIHMPSEKSSHTLTLSEIPFVLGLVMAAPATLIVGRMVGTGLALGAYRRTAPSKVLINLALHYTETVVAITLFRRVIGPTSPVVPQAWPVLLGAVMAGVILTASAIAVIITVLEPRRSLREAWREIAAGTLVSFAIAFVGLVFALLILSEPWTAALMAGIVGLVFAGTKVFERLYSRFEQLRAVYRYTGAVHGSLSSTAAAQAVLGECAYLLRAGYAALLLDDVEGTARRFDLSDGDSDVTISAVPVDWRRFANVILPESGPAHLDAAGLDEWRHWFDRPGPDSVLVGLLVGGSEPVGLLALADRHGSEPRFTEADLQLFDVLLRHTGTTLDRLRVQDELHREVANNETLLRSKDRLIASVSHEIRTPLTGIYGYSELLGEMDDLPPVAREMAEAIASEARDVTHIVEDLLAAARSETDEMKLQSEPVRLDTVCAYTIDSVRMPPTHTVTTSTRAVTALGDELRLRQILRNLLTNAGKYGGPHVEVWVGTNDGEAVVQVVDDGTGVPDEAQARIFDAYQRAHDEATLPGSLGLGLTIARRMARLMGGDLVYRRDRDRSVFELTLPLADVPVEATPWTPVSGLPMPGATLP